MDNSIINIDPELMSGTSVFSGNKVPIQSLFNYPETGETSDCLVEDFPTIATNRFFLFWNQPIKLLCKRLLICSIKVLPDENIPRQLT
jgi:uncharacterized protein (DUF433 family)